MYAATEITAVPNDLLIAKDWKSLFEIADVKSVSTMSPITFMPRRPNA